MTRRRWTNVRFYRRKDGTKVRAHRRRVRRRIPTTIARSLNELASDSNQEYGIALDYSPKHRDIESIYIVPGMKDASVVAGQAKIKIAGIEEEEFIRDFEILMHTHRNIIAETSPLFFPSPQDVITFILDKQKREYEVVLIKSANYAVVMHLPQKQRKKIQMRYHLRTVDGKIHGKNCEKFKQNLNGDFDNLKDYPTWTSLANHWEKKYGLKMEFVDMDKIDEYDFKIIPQGND